MPITDNRSAHSPLCEPPSQAGTNPGSPPPAWWVKLRLEAIYRRLEALRARMALLQRLRGQSARSRRIYRRLAQEAAALLLAAGLLLTPAGGPIHAASITVDGVICTLAEAITSANNDDAAGNGCVDGSGDDIITLQGNVDLTAELDLIQSTVTIEGAGFTIQRTGGGNFRIFTVDGNGNLTINHATISGGNSGNDRGAGIQVAYGTLTLNNSTVSGNTTDESGGGIHITAGDQATLNNSTVSGNSALFGQGGGIYNQGILILNNSTISGNTSYSKGGGVHSSGGTMSLYNTTVTDNECTYSNAPYGLCYGGGISADSSNLTLAHTLITGNTSTGNGREVYATGSTITANNYNLFGHATENDSTAFYGFAPSGSDINATGSGTDVTLTDILDTTLANNGGPVLTHALVSGSPAIDAIPSGSRRMAAASPVLCTPGTSYDQRGVFRGNSPTTNTGTACDIGAFEFGATPTAVTIAGFSSQTAWGRGPKLSWETANETGLSGFHIWRGTAEKAETRLTDSLIGAAGGLNGGEYTWQDSVTYTWGQRSYYWLEALHADGSSTFTGPVEVLGLGKIFLPVTVR